LCNSWSMVGNVLYSSCSTNSEFFFVVNRLLPHTKWTHSLDQLNICPPFIIYQTKSGFYCCKLGFGQCRVGIWLSKEHSVPVRSPCVVKDGPVNQHPPVGAPSTGCLLWLSCGWSSTELLPSFILVTHSVRSRSNI
jgi:hypothetical protein